MSVRAVAAAVVATLAAPTLVTAGWAAAPYAAHAAGSAAGRAAGSIGCVAVVVDAGDLGGPVETGCAEGDPSSGLEALELAGFTATLRPRDGLLCAVGERPDCGDTDGDSYWSYWYRDPGSSKWTYSSLGAGSRDPQPGSVEAWVWQDGAGDAAPAPGEDGGADRRPPAVDYAAVCTNRAVRVDVDPRPGSSPTGVLVGGVLVLGLGGAALLRARRRGGAR